MSWNEMARIVKYVWDMSRIRLTAAANFTRVLPNSKVCCLTLNIKQRSAADIGATLTASSVQSTLNTCWIWYHQYMYILCEWTFYDSRCISCRPMTWWTNEHSVLNSGGWDTMGKCFIPKQKEPKFKDTVAYYFNIHPVIELMTPQT